jgi:hypothetical protein
MEAMLPRSDTLPGIADTDLAGFLRRMRRDANRRYWLGLVVSALFFAVSPMFTIGVPLPAFALPRSLLDRHAGRLLAHPLYLVRQTGFLLRLSAGMCWGADPRVRTCFALPPYAADPGTFRTS